MAKLGVGVGEEFPVDETKPAEGDEARCRARREEGDAMRSEWRARRRAFRKEMRRRWHESGGHHAYEGYRYYGVAVGVVGAVVAVAAVIALAHIIVPLLVLAMIATLGLVFLAMHRRHHFHDHDDLTPDAGA